jgi:glycosyltransferase involved in cell wall biosynthesis
MAIPQLKVNIAGGGDIEGYRTLAKKLGIDKVVTFDGWVDQAKASRLLADADVLILPSYDEGLPLVILEALANGVAVVCTPVGEVPGVFTDQVDACFVRPGDVESIADGLRRVLDDPHLRRNLEQSGRRMYERQFSFASFFENISRIHLKHFGTCAQAKKSSVR